MVEFIVPSWFVKSASTVSVHRSYAKFNLKCLRQARQVGG